jgi:radical SAM protein with 4Fe4S-binding SPASM domain
MPVIREKRFLRVKLDMVTRCQLRCVMCHFAHPDFKESPVTMGGELLEKVANDLFPRAHDVVLSSSAEPLLAKDLPRALELCREHDVPNFHFSTNLFAMNRKIMEKCIEVQMPLLTVSIDGATKETFERIRPPGKWDTLMDRFDLVKEIKEASGSEFPHLSATAVLMRSNIREMPDLIRLMATKGVTQMNFVHMAVMGGLGIEDETLMNDPKLCNDTLREMRRVADEVGIEAMIPMEIPEKIADQTVTDATRSGDGGGSALLQSEEMREVEGSFDVSEYLNHKIDEFLLKAKKKDNHQRACYFPWYYIHVNPDGTVFPCGSWFEFSTFGDFKTQTFNEIWAGKEFKELRRQIRNMELRDVCANCSVANMGRPDVLASFSHRAKVRRGNKQGVSED